MHIMSILREQKILIKSIKKINQKRVKLMKNIKYNPKVYYNLYNPTLRICKQMKIESMKYLINGAKMKVL